VLAGKRFELAAPISQGWRTIKPSNGDNPRSEFGEEQMAELAASIKRHGITTPLTLAPDGEGGFTIIAGERRWRRRPPSSAGYRRRCARRTERR